VANGMLFYPDLARFCLHLWTRIFQEEVFSQPIIRKVWGGSCNKNIVL